MPRSGEGRTVKVWTFRGMRQREVRVPVRHRDRLLMLTAAAIVFVAANASARAQSAGQGFAQGPGQLPGLRGTEDSPVAMPPTQPYTDDDTGAATGISPEVPITGPKYGVTPQPETAPVDGPPSPGGSDNPTFYGQPKPKRSKLYQLPQLHKEKPRGFPPLPPLTTYKTAPGTQKRNSNAPARSPTDTSDPGPTVAVIPVLPAPPKPKRDDNPYQQLGINVGSLRLYPYGEVDTGYDTNPNLVATGVKGSTFVHGETGGRLESLWSQDSLTADLRAGYWDYFSNPDANRPEGNGTVDARIDVTRDTKINLESRFSVATQSPGSPQIAIPGATFTTNRPLIVTLGQTAGVSQQFNRLTLDLRASFDRDIFGNATESDGTELPLSLDNYNTYGITGRASYELTPGLAPYIELRGDARRYDSYYDIGGFARNSDGIAGKVGARFEAGRLITGDVAVGYADRDYVDPRLPHLQSPTLDAKVNYAVTPLTTLTLNASTVLSETTTPFASGAVAYEIDGQVAHQLFRNLTLTGKASYQINDYQGVPITEHLWSIGVGADYNITRFLMLRGSYAHTQLTSNLAGDYYTGDVFLLGLKYMP
ncbi:MAG TPA: outer membrane beta-barrel protein [Methylovirgula sp.]|nr:outer membrane beta-barrel protein [Methylovirgula sp.]